MKRERTEYSESSKTVERIACNNCDERFENRSADGVTTLFLDGTVARYNMSYGGRNYLHEKRWGYRTSTSNVIMKAEAVADFCGSCLPSTFADDGVAIEVSDEEYIVEESTVEEFVCDVCEDTMGEEPDHTVQKNPRIKYYRKVRALHEEQVGLCRNPDESIGGGRVSMNGMHLKSDIDEEFHVCHEDAVVIFDLPEEEEQQPHGLMATIKGTFLG